MSGINRDLLSQQYQSECELFERLHPRSAELARGARQNLVSGVPMPWMTRLPGGFPLFLEEARGGHFTDVDGREYVDFCLGDTGAMTGHALPQVAEAIHHRALNGTTRVVIAGSNPRPVDPGRDNVSPVSPLITRVSSTVP